MGESTRHIPTIAGAADAPPHVPVLYNEVMDALRPASGRAYLDLSLIHISEPTRPY